MSESKPFIFNYTSYYLVDMTTEDTVVTTTILTDDSDRIAPLEQDNYVKPACKLTMNILKVDLPELAKTRGHDGNRYYKYEFSIEAVYFSASTSFRLIHKGKYSICGLYRALTDF